MASPLTRFAPWPSLALLSVVMGAGCPEAGPSAPDDTSALLDVAVRDGAHDPGGTGTPDDGHGGADGLTGADAPDAPDAPNDLGPAEVSDAASDTGPELPQDVPPTDVLPDGAVDTVEDVPSSPTYPLACESPADCVAPCVAGQCTDGECAFYAASSGCVVVDEVAGTFACVEPWVTHPEFPCALCNPLFSTVGWTSVFLQTDFEGPMVGLTAANLSGSAAGWSVVKGRAASGTHSLYFGDPEALTYAVDDRAWGRVTSTAFAVPAGVAPELSFLLWLDTEETPEYDVLRVQAIAPGRVETLWTSDAIGGTTRGEFLPVSLLLEGFAGETIQVALEFDSVDDIINGYEGAYVDDFRLTIGCCAEARDCVDGNACSDDACPALGAACSHDVSAGCCNVDLECEDGDVCTAVACTGAGGTCVITPIAGCCEVATDCDDDDPCTEDQCVAAELSCRHVALCCEVDADCHHVEPCLAGACTDGACVYTDTCCHADVECSDGDLCTHDLCVAGACVYSPANFPGCCETNLDCDDGDPCTKDACDVATGSCVSTPIAGCCVSAADCDDGSPLTTDDCVSGKCFNCGDGSCSAAEKCDTCEPDCGPCATEGSCVGKCGGSSGYCYCDESCMWIGDCCYDACTACGLCW